MYFHRIPIWTKGYKVLNLSTNEIIVSRHVKFVETVFPLHNNHFKEGVTSCFPKAYDCPDSEFSPNGSVDHNDSSTNAHSDAAPSNDNSASTYYEPSLNVPLRKSTRATHPPTYLNDYICNNVTNHDDNGCDRPHTITNMFIPDATFCSHVVNLTEVSAFNVNSKVVEPSYYHQAKGNPLWEEAMQ